MSELFKNRPLTHFEKQKMSEGEQEVIRHYEKVTKRVFMRHEVNALKKCIRAATPGAIISSINMFHYRYPQNFKDFNYLVKPIANNKMLRNSRGGTKKTPKK